MASPGRPQAALAFGLTGVALFTAGLGASYASPAASAAGLAVAGIGSSGGLACFAIAGALLMREPLNATLGLLPLRFPLARSAALAAGLIGLSLCTDALLQTSGLRDRSSLPDLDAVIADASPPELALLSIGIALAPGIAEELLFRGWLLHAFSQPLGMLPGAALTTLLFGALHLDPVHAFAACVLGTYLVCVRIQTGSTAAAALCHVANNLAAIAIAAQGGFELSWSLAAAVPIAFGCTAWLAYSLVRDTSGGRAAP